MHINTQVLLIHKLCSFRRGFDQKRVTMCIITTNLTSVIHEAGDYYYYYPEGPAIVCITFNTKWRDSLHHLSPSASGATVSIRYFRTRYICQHWLTFLFKCSLSAHSWKIPSSSTILSFHTLKWVKCFTSLNNKNHICCSFFENLWGDTLWLLMHHHDLKCKILDGSQPFASWNTIKSLISLYSLQHLTLTNLSGKGGNLATHSRTRLKEYSHGIPSAL